jgi:hypothetical protein
VEASGVRGRLAVGSSGGRWGIAFGPGEAASITGNNESELGTDVRLIRSRISPDYFSFGQTPKLADPIIGLTNVQIMGVLIVNDVALKGERF